MRQFIFYTCQGFTEGPNEEEVDNCQLLGHAEGESAEKAFENLLKENPWITAKGFHLGLGNIIGQELLDRGCYFF